MGGGRERGGPTRAQPSASLCERRRTRTSRWEVCVVPSCPTACCTSVHPIMSLLARNGPVWPSFGAVVGGFPHTPGVLTCQPQLLAWLPLGRRCRSLSSARPVVSCSCWSCSEASVLVEDIRDACFEPLLRGERAPGCAGVQEDLTVATLLCCCPG